MKHLIQPFAPFSYVADDLAVGGVAAYGQDLPFGLALNVAYELVGDGRPAIVKGVPVLQFKLDDTKDVADHAKQAAEVLRAVVAVRSARALGKPVLVTCAQGRNRSAMVAAEYLIQCGNRPQDVIQKIKDRRANSLMNPTFVAWLERPRR